MLLFRSEEHRDAWLSARDLNHGASISVDKQWELARIWYHNRASPEWRRRTRNESQDVLQSLGLIGPFWDLSPPVNQVG